MRLIVLIAALGIGLLFSACPSESGVADNRTDPPTREAVTGDRSPVLVELFTSEGCSSCPPADRELAFLEQQQPVAKADIVTLAFHVDYWDHLGWKDRFSSPLYSRRQETYAHAFKLDSNYTPQMVVDGVAEFVGSDGGRASREIVKASASTKAEVNVAVDGRRATVKIVNAPPHHEATVYAAIAEDGISSRVERGENSGKTLEHVSVVRELKTVGSLTADKNELESSIEVQAPTDSKPDRLKVVIFVQENDSRKILGIGRAGWRRATAGD